MSGEWILILVALALRLSGASMRSHSRFALGRGLGWLLCALATWLAASAFMPGAPLWTAGLVGAVVAALAVRDLKPMVALAMDVLLVALAGELAVPWRGWSVMGMMAVACLTVAGIGDALATRLTRRRPWIPWVQWSPVAALTAAVTVALMLDRGTAQQTYTYISRDPSYPLAISVGPRSLGRRVALASHAVAWLEQPTVSSASAAVFFHGAHPDGARQRPACVLRRALLQAGFHVISVDHPGYGASPAPAHDAPIQAWDPMPVAESALELAKSLPGVRHVIVVGHSMGSNEVLRLLDRDRGLAAAVILGAGLSDPSSRDEYWHKRFNTDRRLDPWVSLDRFIEIRKRYYHRGGLSEGVFPDHPTIYCGQFGFEHRNIVSTREDLYSSLPGRKAVWDLADTTHYLNALAVSDLLLDDTRITRRLADLFAYLRRDIEGDPAVQVVSRPAEPSQP